MEEESPTPASRGGKFGRRMFDRGDDKQRDYQWLVKPDGALTVALGDFTMKNKDRILKSLSI